MRPVPRWKSGKLLEPIPGASQQHDASWCLSHGPGAGSRAEGSPVLLPCPVWAWLLGSRPSALPAPVHWSYHGLVSPPDVSQLLAFPFSRFCRDAVPMAPRGSSSGGQPGAAGDHCCLPGCACCCAASPLISAPATKAAGAFGACPAPPVTQTGPAAREQGVKGQANIWREVQPIPHTQRGATHGQAALRGQGGPQELCHQPPARSGLGGGGCVLAASLRHRRSEDFQQQCTAGSTASGTSGATQQVQAVPTGHMAARAGLRSAALPEARPGLWQWG